MSFFLVEEEVHLDDNGPVSELAFGSHSSIPILSRYFREVVRIYLGMVFGNGRAPP